MRFSYHRLASRSWTELFLPFSLKKSLNAAKRTGTSLSSSKDTKTHGYLKQLLLSIDVAEVHFRKEAFQNMFPSSQVVSSFMQKVDYFER